VAGKYLSPGFIDLHVHGGADCDFMDGNEEAVVKAANFHYQNGTTTICPTTLSAS
jgi:N-acetylglucosamine-6-phosphate deacetylase